MEYTIVYEDNLHKFIEEVNQMVKDGYECVGGVTTRRWEFFPGVTYMQAMISEENNIGNENE